MLRQTVFLILSFSVSVLFGQSSINIKHYSVKDGLSQKNIQNFIQDDYGYIWMSTWNGLERFDGYSFNNYKTHPRSAVRITNHRFTEIKKSSLNNIWGLTYDNHCYLFNTKTHEYEDPFLYVNGLTNSVRKLYVLNNGITWAIGMQGELYRINESKFPKEESVEFFAGRSENSLNDIIYNIIQDKDGDEWILTDKGIIIVGKKSIVNSMPFEFMVETSTGIFLATSKGLFVKYDPQTQDVLSCMPEQTISEIAGLKSLPDNRIAILQNKNIMIYNSDNGEFTRYEVPIEIKSDAYQDRKGNLWILGQTDGVILLDYINGKLMVLHYPRISEIPFSPLSTFVHEDEYGCIWIKPVSGEFCFYDPINQSLEQAYIYDMGVRKPISLQALSNMSDRQSNLWYSDGNGFGYISFHKKSSEYITNNHKEPARALMEDAQKRLWIGWKRNHRKQPGYVCLYDSFGKWLGNLSEEGKILFDHRTTFNADVYCIYEDKDRNIWLGTKEDGLYFLRFKGDNNYQVTHYKRDKDNPYSISSDIIYSILQDSAGRIWLATFGGGINLVNRLSDGDSLQFIHSGNLLSNYPIHVCDKVRCLYETDNGIIYIGTTGGLLSCSADSSRPEVIHFYHNVCNERYSSLSSNDVMDISQAGKNKLLVTTIGCGVNVLDNRYMPSDTLFFKHYNATNSLVPDWSLSTIEDTDGNIWVASENKLSKFDSEMNLLGEYNDQIQMTDAKPIMYSSGKLLFGSVLGALQVTPSDMYNSHFVPPIVFSHLDINLNNNSRQQKIYCNEVTQFLKASERNLMITFAALDYVNPSAIKYAYRIKGISEQWIEIGSNRSASLINMPAGNYLFQVKSTNADGVWVDNVTSLPLHIEPTFPETVWAVLLYIVMAITVLFIVVYVVIRITNLQRKIDFEQQLSNLKLRFFTDISHELRTPLTLIASPIDEVMNNEKLSETGIENMQVAKRNTDRMLRLINQILDFRKIQNDKMKVLVEYVDVIPLISKIYGNFLQMAHTRSINFQLNCSFDSFIMYTDVDKLEKILFNLLSNAFKYTPNEKNISLSVTGEKQTLCLQVKDEGRGISSQKINKLFTRFETLDEVNPRISTGIGLSLVKELLNLLHGTIKVDSKLGEGSLFTVKLPGDYDTFSKDTNVEFIMNDSDTTELQQEVADISLSSAEKDVRILLIEDNEELRHFISRVLAKDYVVFEAENGKQGLDITLAEMPDIVISDIMMPEVNGIEYLKSVKANRDICHIPIILLSAKSSLADQIQGLEYGADEYITKPFSSSLLKVKVESILRQRQILYEYYAAKITEKADADIMGQLELSTPQITHFDDDFIRNILQSVENNIQNSDFKIDDLAEAMGMSRAVFYRKVKSLIGVSPIDFIKNMRIKRAVQLLEQSEYTVAEVGYMSGFATPQYFNRVFKEVMSCTPKEYKMKKK